MELVSKMWEGLDRIRNGTSNLPAKAYARKSFLDAISEQIGMVQDDKYTVPAGAVASFAGMPVYLTESLPQGVLCWFIDKDDKPLGQIIDDTYVPPDLPTNKSEDGI